MELCAIMPGVLEFESWITKHQFMILSKLVKLLCLNFFYCKMGMILYYLPIKIAVKLHTHMSSCVYHIAEFFNTQNALNK